VVERRDDGTERAARRGAQISYDVIRRRTVLFGGRSSAGAELGDTWEWDGATWTQTATEAQGPGARFLASFDYDGTRRRNVLYGGVGAANFADTWEHYTRGGSCSLGAQCATGYCTDGVCCEQLSCGTCEACNTTGAPGVCAAVTSADDPDTCPAATSTCDANGFCKKKQGQPCSGNLACGSGYCVDGYCCDKACDGGCDVCNATPGTCTVFAKGATGAAPSCGPYLCDGSNGACPSACAADADCGSGYFCASGGVCLARRTAGKSCNTAASGDCAVAGCRECTGSNTCVDGVCCTTACAGSCQTCAATPGTCTTVTSADDPDTCTGASTCSSSGSCLAKQGQSCTAASQCASGNCVDGYCCDTSCAGGCDTCSSKPGTCSIVAQGSAGASPSCGAYVCNGSTASCPSSCANDADCASGYYCGAGGTCLVRKAQGSTCSTAANVDCRTAGCRVCTTGNCIDGYCCDTVCAGACNACNGADLAWSSATNGTCKIAPISYAGSPSCGAFACDGASQQCASFCSSDAHCGSGYYCNAAGACVAQKAQGTSCNTAAGADCRGAGCRVCATGNCVDGYCCNTSCTGQCQACDVGGALGACVTVTGTVHLNASIPARTACAGSGTCGATCNGVDPTSCKYAGSAVACGSLSCGSGLQTNLGTCNGAGTCNQTQTPCGAYACGATSCKTSCNVDADCASSSYYCSGTGGSCLLKKNPGDTCTAAAQCASGNCVSGVCCDSACGTAGYSCTISGSVGTCKKVNGTTCSAATECGSGICVDGVCCNSACTGQCQACNLAASKGTCSNVTGAPVGGRAACGGTGAGTTCGAVCDGVTGGACTFPKSVTCSAASCAAGTETSAGTCDGGGACTTTTKSCGAYACGASACKTSCTLDTDCASSGYYCNGGTCTTKKLAGDTCSSANACASGNCVSGVCCDTACGTAGYSCTISGSVGTCKKVNGTACSAASECGSGICVDGVCCNSSCTGQCQACNLAASKGTCSNAYGAPVGGRPACGGAGAGTTCGAICDGVTGGACTFPKSVTCSAASCASGVESTAGACDGAGVCAFTTKACGAYVCGASSCKSICTADADCATDFYCKVGACTPKENKGTACTASSACLSGNCVDGVCCGSASCGAGERCNVTGSLGTCSKPNGISCAGSTECASGFCVDGVCCDTKCGSQCAACDLTGKVGTCSAVTGAPRGTRAACAGAAGECGAVCNGTDVTACHYPTGAKSCGAASCKTSGGNYIETHVSVCDGAGACSDEPKTCGGFVCGASSCKTGCTGNTDCTTGFYCKSGACIPIEGLGTTCSDASTCTSGFCTDGVCCAVGSCGAGKSCSAGATTQKGLCVSLNGTTCTADAECASGACVDGVCCDSACKGPCEACNKIGSLGKCVPIVGAPQAGHPICAGTSTDADCAQRCDGTDGTTCKYPGTTTTCGAPSCGGGEETEVSTCDGAGACKPALKTCAPYVCGATACLASCTKSADCASGNYCLSGACVKVLGLGKACGGPEECGSGFCADGVCCSVASCGAGSSCAAESTLTPGACLKKKGVACTRTDDCASGHCVDGVCCDSACSGQCEACDVTGSEGACTPVVGGPHLAGGARVACDDKVATDCAKAQCDGTTRDKCAGFANGASVSCGADACTVDKRFQKHGTCDGAGGCALPDPKPCTPYGCDAASSSGCKSACAIDDDCAAEFKCESGACVQGAHCSDDQLSSIAKSGETKACTPYRCGTDGKCETSCASSADCAPGLLCDDQAKACVLQSTPTNVDGGCAVGAPGGTPGDEPTAGGGAAALLALLGLGLLRRARAA
jgi:hypothetical protein